MSRRPSPPDLAEPCGARLTCSWVRPARLVSRRTATINQIRAFLIEQGIAVRTGSRALRNSLFEILKNRNTTITLRHEQNLLMLTVHTPAHWLLLHEPTLFTGPIESLPRSAA